MAGTCSNRVPATNKKRVYYILTINQIGRPRPAMGCFLWSNELNRYVWKSLRLRTCAEMAQAVNEGLEFMRVYDEPLLQMSLMAIEQPEEAETQVPKESQVPTAPKQRKLPVLSK